MQIRYLAALVLSITLCDAPKAQEKVPAPRQITVRPGALSLSPAQVEKCLVIAREISVLTDRASVAEARADTDTFNATVDPYNDARRRWNAGCLTPYDPADMIRAENRMGARLCKFTRTPCMSDDERNTILAQERARQRGTAPPTAPPRARITRATEVALSRPSPAPDRAGISRSTAAENTSMYAWWLTQQVPAVSTTYRTIPTMQLKLPLAALSVLSCHPSSRQFTEEQCAEVKADGAVFMVVEDVDGDGRNEILETAVGRTPDGRQVAVLIVSSDDDAWNHRIFIQEGLGFSALFRSAEGVSWFTCMECGHGFKVSADALTHEVELVGDGYLNNPETHHPTRSAATATDLEAEAAWTLHQKAEAVAIAAVQSRYSKAQLQDSELDGPARYQEEVLGTQVRQLVRASLPGVDIDAIGRVTQRILDAGEIGMEEAVATVCYEDIVAGRYGGAEERCGEATRRGFLHAYERRQQLESR